MTAISMDQEGASETNTPFDLIVGLCNFGLCHVVDDIIDYLDTRYDQYSTFQKRNVLCHPNSCIDYVSVMRAQTQGLCVDSKPSANPGD